MSSPDPLSPAAIVAQMAEALPTHAKDDTTSDLSSSLDAIALFTHACMANLGFTLLGFGEDQKIGMSHRHTHTWTQSRIHQLTSSFAASECARIAPRLPAQWNRSLSSISFVYSHTQSSMQFVIRVDRLGGRTEIRGLAVGDDRIARFEISARDYISAAALPLRIPLSSTTATDNNDGTATREGEQQEDRGDELRRRLQVVFISPERIADLASLLKINVVQRLLPSLQKEGYQEDPDDRAARQDAESSARSGARPPARMPDPLPPPAQPTPYPTNDPLAPPLPGRRPVPIGDFPPPDFEDEYEVNRPPRGPLMPPHFGGASPFGIGDRDLYPAGLGPHDPLRGSFVPPPGGRGPGGASGGMHPTFDDPLFGGPARGQTDPSFDPQAPPGARWDPLGPGGLPRFGGGRPGGPGGGGFGGGFGGSGFGGDII